MDAVWREGEGGTRDKGMPGGGSARPGSTPCRGKSPATHVLAPRLDLLQRMEVHLQLLLGPKGHVSCRAVHAEGFVAGKAWMGSCSGQRRQLLPLVEKQAGGIRWGWLLLACTSSRRREAVTQAGRGVHPPKTKSEAVPMRGLLPMKQ
jgi:hypothetical protein